MRKRQHRLRGKEASQINTIRTRMVMGVAIRRIIKELDKETRKVAELAKERNTKKEIKEGASKLRSLISQITTSDAQVLLQTLGRKTKDTKEGKSDDEMEKHEKEIQELRKEIENMRKEINSRDEEMRVMRLRLEVFSTGNIRMEEGKVGKEASTQTEGGGIIDLEEEDKINKIRKAIDDAQGYMNIEHIIEEDWPEGVYRNTEVIEGNPLTTTRDKDHAIILQPNEENMDKGIHKQYAERIPDIKDVEYGENGLATIVQTIRIRRNGENEDKVNYIYKGKLGNGSEVAINDMLVEISLEMTRLGRDEVMIPRINNVEIKKLRKIAEVVGSKYNKKLKLFTNKTRNQKSKQSKTEVRKKTKEWETEAIIMKTTGSSYANLLREIRTEVKTKGMYDGIRGVRQTKKGDMLITVDKKEKTDSIRKVIGMKIGEQRIRDKIKPKPRIFHIKYMDGITTKEEIQEAVINGIKHAEIDAPMEYKTEDVIVSNLRPSFGNCLTATIKTSDAMGNELSKISSLMIGIVRCKIEERIEVTRCFRCWGYEHIARDCEKEDRSKNCWKCNSQGHAAMDCKERNWCSICTLAGHRVGTMACPKYRQALIRAKTKARRETPN